MATKSKQTQLDAIQASIVSDNVCPELAKGATQLVFGDGNADSDIVFIGEAPGKNEDLQGKPFVGASGKFLNEMLAMINLKREDIYITNIVKYRPPNNRDPLPEEKTTFLPYLQSQLDVIQPKVVVTLGRHSMNCFLPSLQISQVHGQPKRIKIHFAQKSGNGQGASAMQGAGEQRTESYEKYGDGAAQSATPQGAASDDGSTSSAREPGVTSLVILPLFHPAAALYNGGMRQTLIEDFLKLPEVIKQVTEAKQAKK